jgi:amino acid transporter
VKLRLTPMNIISSVLIVSMAYLFIFADENGWSQLGTVPLLILFVLSFVSDIIFRRLIKDLKRIWLFELLFIIFVAVLILLIKSQFN